MELDELGALLNNHIDQHLPTTNHMIYQSTTGPLTAYTKNLKFTMIAFPCASVLFIGRFLNDDAARHSPVAWMLPAILFVEFLFSCFNYAVVKTIKNAEGSVQQNLLKKITLMQKTLGLYLYLHLFLYAAMAVVLEVTMKNHLDNNFNGWARVNLGLRLLVYSAFLVAQFFMKRASQEKHYSRYLHQIQQLAGQLV